MSKNDKIGTPTRSGLFDGRTGVGPLTLLGGRLTLSFEQGTSLVVVGALEAPRFAFANEAWMVVATRDATRTRIIDLQK